ncbi:MAG: NAD(P)/FAD-dependent oxidoreductase [Actinomycetota bacterium]
MSNNRKYDAVIIGGGHNGLVSGAYLAKAGLDVVVLERRPFVGGAAITEELIPGFKFTTFSYALSLIRPDVVQDLELAEHGMMTLPMPSELHLSASGEYLQFGPDEHQNYHELARYSIEDAEAMRDYFHMLDRVRHALKPLMDRIPPNPASDDPKDVADLAAFNDYLDGLEPDVRAMIGRFYNGSVADVLDEYFESDLLKGLLAGSGIIGSMCGPRSKESGLVYLLHVLGERDGIFGEWGFHKEGNGGLTKTLRRAFEAFGGTVECDVAVDHVIEEDGRAVGVRLAGGEVISADVVVSSLDPRRTFLDLVDPDTMPADLVEAITEYKFQGSASKVNFALDDLPTFPGFEGRADIFQGFTNIGPSMDYLQEAFDDAAAGRISRRPFLDCCVQSTIDPDMTPPGKHIMSCFVMYTPYQLAEGDWDSERETLGDIVQETLGEIFPGFDALVLHREVVTPLDIERVVGITEGNIFHGELFESQMFFNRPAPGWNQYRTPLAGYYQCGSGTHPGGCVMGGPGKLAAQQILSDRTSVA